MKKMPGIRDRHQMYGPGPYEGPSKELDVEESIERSVSPMQGLQIQNIENNNYNYNNNTVIPEELHDSDNFGPHFSGYNGGAFNNGGANGNGGPGYYYSRDHSAGPSSASATPKSSSFFSKMDGGRSRSRLEDDTPSYWVEHLATFAVGKQYGLEQPADGIRKLKQMEKSSAIWAQPMILRLKHSTVLVEDENGEVVEQFAMQLVQDPTAHLSTDPRDVYNNILLFIVREDRRHNSATPTEMHIFQCNRVSANEVVDDFRQYLGGNYARVAPGRRDKGFVPNAETVPQMAGGTNGMQAGHGAAPVVNSYTRTEKTEFRNSRGDAVPSNSNGYQPPPEPRHVQPEARPWPYSGGAIRDDVSASSDASEYFERDVNTLNRCFDDIERFVARIQSAALAQRELEAHTTRRRKGARTADPGILSHRAQLPAELEFVDVLQKFKLSFNLLAKLKNHIHEPNAPELLHFLFTPLTVIIDACQWGVGRNIAPSVISPLLTRDAVDLMKNCLTSKESDVWMALGEPWRIPPEDWPGLLPPPYRPIFADGYMPYGPPGGPVPYPPPAESTASASGRPTPRRGRSVDNLDRSMPVEMDRLSLEQERLSFEKDKLLERERRVLEQQKLIADEKKRLEDERRRFYDEQERQSTRSQPLGPTPFAFRPPSDSAQSSPAQPQQRDVPVYRDAGDEDSPRQRAFVEDLRQRHTKVAQVTYDRRGQNAKELTVFKGEYLEVLSDTRNWWECRNVHNRIGYVPHTIVTVIARGNPLPASAGLYVETDPNSSPSRSGDDDFVEVSNVAIQANLIKEESRASFTQTNTRAPVSAAPPPAPGPAPDIGTLTLNGARPTVPKPEPVKRTQPKLEATPRATSDFHRELISTVSKPFKPRAINGPDLVIDEKSNAEQIHQWLQSKGFSPRTIEVLHGQTGATLFALGRPQLQQYVGKEEGSMLYSKLLVQKNLTGYQTKSGAQLQAILNARRPKVDPASLNGSAAHNATNYDGSGSKDPAPAQLEQLFHQQQSNAMYTSSQM